MFKGILLMVVVFVSQNSRAQTYGFGPSNLGSDLQTMTKAQVLAVKDSASVKAYAANGNLGAVTEVEYVYTSLFGKGSFAVYTTKGCVFEAKVKLSSLTWKAFPVKNSEKCN